MSSEDYQHRTYLSATESAMILGMSVDMLHSLVRKNIIKAKKSASGQYRFNINDLQDYKKLFQTDSKETHRTEDTSEYFTIFLNNTTQKIFCKSASNMSDIDDNSIHLVVTSPPYFNTKLYSGIPLDEDIGNIHSLDEWFSKISIIWKETFRVLQPGRKAFINIMNLPIRLEQNKFRTLNLVGRTIDACEQIGFIFKRDIVWEKTNSVRAPIGTYPYPGGILINNNHEFILEFEKPEQNKSMKYAHLTREQKENSKLDKEFWINIKKSDVWKMKPEGSGDRRNHIAPFPYELPFRLIKAFSFIGETVLDPFMGSGTTLLAAADLQRNGIGYEIYKDIVLVAIKRLKNHQPKLI